MRLRLAVLVGAIALAVSACIGGPTPGGTPAQTISANVHNNTRLAAGSCGSPEVVPPDDIESWVGSATGMVRGKVLKLTRGPTSPSNVRLQIDIEVGAVYGDTVADPGDVVHGQITIWNQPNEEEGWNAYGAPLTFERFDDTMETILPIIEQYGPHVGGRLCYPIMFGTPTDGAFLSGTNWGTLDGVEDAASEVVLSH